MVALVARYHRKSAPSAKHAEFAALRPVDQDTVRALAAILRVAIGLDRTHAGLVTSVRCSRRGKELVIEAVARPGADLGLELYTANERKGLLEEVLGRPIRIEAVDPGLAAAEPDQPDQPAEPDQPTDPEGPDPADQSDLPARPDDAIDQPA